MKKRDAKIIYNEIHNPQKALYWYEKHGFNFYYYYLKLRDRITGKRSLLHFTYETNTQCTLRCKECHSYMPYFTKETHYSTDFETFKREIDKLLKSVDLIVSFRLQGGETLLVKDLVKIVEYACSKPQIQHIQIISNGTIMPSKELIEAMKTPKVLFSLSDYSANEDIRDRLKYKEIIQVCKENHVNVKHWLTAPGAFWVGRNAISNKDINDKDLAIKNLKNCYCFGIPKNLNFFKGKLYICASAVYFASINPDFRIPEGEVIDVMNTPTKLLTAQIKEFESKRYFALCSRCDATEKVKHVSQPGVQLEQAQTLAAVESNPAKSV